MQYKDYQKQAILEKALNHPISEEVLSEGLRFDSIEEAVINWLAEGYDADSAILEINELIRAAFISHWKENNLVKGGLIEHEGKIYEVELLEEALETFEDQRKNGVVNNYDSE
jgi:hypothetical protein